MLHKMVCCWTRCQQLIYANNYCFSDSHYAILIVGKQNATGNLLWSIKQHDQGDWDNQGDWNDWDYKDDWMAWMIGMTQDDQGSRLILMRMTRVTVISRMTEMTGVAGMTRIAGIAMVTLVTRMTRVGEIR